MLLEIFGTNKVLQCYNRIQSLYSGEERVEFRKAWHLAYGHILVSGKREWEGSIPGSQKSGYTATRYRSSLLSSVHNG